MKKILTLIIIGLLMMTLFACSNENDEMAKEIQNSKEASTLSDTEAVESERVFLPIDTTILDDNRPEVTIKMSDGQLIVIKLVPEIAPNTVNSFLSLATDGFYDGLTFHRIIAEFMIQGGDPEGTGMGDPGYSIRDEFYIFDEAENSITYLPHKRGVLSMGKSEMPDSTGCQFFIVQTDSGHLDGFYSAFGYVVEGMEVVDELSMLDTNQYNAPLVDVVMKEITVNLNGYLLEAPEVFNH